MQIARKTLMPFLAAVAVVALNTSVFAVSYTGSATVAGALAAGYNGTNCGQPVKIDVNLSANTVKDRLNLAVPPVSASFKVFYTTDSLTFSGLEGGLLGAVLTYSPEYPTSNPNEVYRIVKGANTSNAALTGTLYTVVFSLKSDGYKPYSVSFSDDLTTLTPLRGIDTAPPPPPPVPDNYPEFDMLNYYDNTGTENIGAGTTAGTACGTATIASSIVPLAGPCGGDFDMPISVVLNSTGQIPTSFAFRVVYDTTQVAFVSAADADLGAVLTSGETTISGTQVYRRVSTVGLPGATDPTPVCAVLTFNQLGIFPFTVEVQDDPLGEPLVADYTFKSMYHVYDNDASTNVAGVPCTQVDDWMLFGTAGNN